MLWTDRARGSPRKSCPAFMAILRTPPASVRWAEEEREARRREREREGPSRFQNQITIYKRDARGVFDWLVYWPPPLYPPAEEKIIFSKLLMMFHPRLINPRTAVRLTAAAHTAYSVCTGSSFGLLLPSLFPCIMELHFYVSFLHNPLGRIVISLYL